MELIEEYNKLISICEKLDYSHEESVFEYADKLSFYSYELALIIMINILINGSQYLDEAIYDHIFIAVEAEGNRNIYLYIEKIYQSATDIYVRSVLKKLLNILIQKYDIIRKCFRFRR